VRILLRSFNTAMLDLKLRSGAEWVRARSSWMLLTLVAVSLLSAPLTQQFWTWDRFLHGGQDFETGALLILISLCLVVVLTRVCKSGFERLLAALRVLALLRHPAAECPLSSARLTLSPPARNPRAAYCLPLLI
jgi:hypothetical protein